MKLLKLFYAPLVLYIFAVSVVPLAFLMATAFTADDMSGSFSWDFSLINFEDLFADTFYLERLAYTLGLTLLVTAVTLAIAVPVTWFIVELKYFWRTVWLVGLFSSLALSEVLAVYAWQLLLGHSSGIPGWFESMGLVLEAESWWPGFPAMVLVLVYYTVPVAIIVLFPPFSRLAPSLAESARTMGFGAMTIFFRVILPSIREPLLRTGLLCFLLNIGGFVISQQLGRPEDWMFSVFIADFMRSFNIPLAVTMALLLLVSLLAVLGGILGAFRWRAVGV